MQGDYLRFRANPHYFLGAPHIQHVVVDIIPSPTTAVAQLETGAVDLVDASNPLTPSQYQAASKHPNVTGYTNTNLSWKNITLSEMGLFRDLYVRQALDYATPKHQLIKSILSGYATPAYYSQPQTSWQGTMTGVHEYPFNLSRAKSLLTAHGFQMVNGVMTLGGQKLDVTLYASSTDPQNQLIARVLQQDWCAGTHSTGRPQRLVCCRGPVVCQVWVECVPVFLATGSRSRIRCLPLALGKLRYSQPEWGKLCALQ